MNLFDKSVKAIPVAMPLYSRDGWGAPAAMLVSQIHFYTSRKDAMKREGYAWVRKSTKQWAEELLVSERTAERAVKALTEAGICVIGNFNKAGYDRTNWYRLDYQKLNEIAKVNERLLTDKIAPGRPENGGIISTILAESHIREQIPFQIPSRTASPLGGKDLQMKIVKNGKGTPVKIPKKPSSSDAVLAEMQRKKHNLPEVPPNSTKSGEAILRTFPQYNEEFGMMPGLGMKGLVHLAAVVKEFGADSDRNLELLVRNWFKFTQYVREKESWSKSFSGGITEYPKMSFVRTHIAHAVNWCAQQVKVQPVAQAPQKPQPKVKIVAAAPKPPIPVEQVTREEEPATNEDVLALMKEFGVIPEGK
jgi:hypothetical protein